MPGEIQAGETYTIGFTVLQHGQTPVHELGEGYPVEPVLFATNPVTDEHVQVDALPTKKPGHFETEITFPSEGEWKWSVTPRPFGEQDLGTLTVHQAAPASLLGTGQSMSLSGGMSTATSLMLFVGSRPGSAGCGCPDMGQEAPHAGNRPRTG
ncbi:MAG: hypothetical protein R3C44_17680 [Chloroflexota bacterium]